MGYITKSDLTSTCDFGSQMSQYASLVSIGKKTGLTPVFIEETLHKRWGFPLETPFVHKPTKISANEFLLNPVHTIVGDIMNQLSGFSTQQNYDALIDMGLYSHFHDIKPDIINLFTFTSDIVDSCKQIINTHKSDGSLLVSIHFRRGDYLQFSSLNLTMNYYIEAIQYLTTKYNTLNIKFLIFSNDIEWCKNNIDGDCVFIENLTRYQDMCLMSMCDCNIIANSSFSWWGAYLNNNVKDVICPYNYLNVSSINHLVNGKYFPKEWHSININ